MKTIKELEAENKKCSETFKLLNIEKINAFKEVLGLIDAPSEVLKTHYEEIKNENKEDMSFDKGAVTGIGGFKEELKQKIEGKDTVLAQGVKNG